MAFYQDTPQNVDVLARLLGFEPVVAEAWLRNEGQGTNNPTNPLNIRWYDRDPQTGYIVFGTNGRFATYADAQAGLRDAVDILRRLAPAYGYGAILAQSGSGDAYAQARAIELSSWSAGHYGALPDRDGGISRYVLTNTAPETEMPAPITNEDPALIDIPAGAPLYDLDSATKLTTLTSGFKFRLSPYGVGSRRAIFVTTGGVRRVALVTPTATRPVDCAAAISAAVAPFQARIAAAKAALD